MSTRRKVGDRVWVVIEGRTKGEWAFIVPTEGGYEVPCWRGCDDPDCVEFPTLRFVNREGYMYHVCECKMHDAPLEKEL